MFKSLVWCRREVRRRCTCPGWEVELGGAAAEPARGRRAGRPASRMLRSFPPASPAERPADSGQAGPSRPVASTATRHLTSRRRAPGGIKHGTAVSSKSRPDPRPRRRWVQPSIPMQRAPVQPRGQLQKALLSASQLPSTSDVVRARSGAARKARCELRSAAEPVRSQPLGFPPATARVARRSRAGMAHAYGSGGPPEVRGRREPELPSMRHRHRCKSERRRYTDPTRRLKIVQSKASVFPGSEPGRGCKNYDTALHCERRIPKIGHPSSANWNGLTSRTSEIND